VWFQACAALLNKPALLGSLAVALMAASIESLSSSVPLAAALKLFT
jgi:hypothetical protein